MTPEDKLVEEAGKVKAAEIAATGWIKTHMAWAIGAICFITGFIFGHIV